MTVGALTVCSDGYDGDQQDATKYCQADDGEAVGPGATRPGDHSDWGHWVSWKWQGGKIVS